MLHTICQKSLALPQDKSGYTYTASSKMTKHNSSPTCNIPNLQVKTCHKASAPAASEVCVWYPPRGQNNFFLNPSKFQAEESVWENRLCPSPPTQRQAVTSNPQLRSPSETQAIECFHSGQNLLWGMKGGSYTTPSDETNTQLLRNSAVTTNLRLCQEGAQAKTASPGLIPVNLVDPAFVEYIASVLKQQLLR